MRTRVAIATLVQVLLITGSIAAESNEGRHSRGEQSSSSLSRSCVNELSPCLTYLNRNGNGNRNGNRNKDESNPPDSCCDPLKQVIKEKGECLCSLISNEGSAQAEQAGINVTLAQQLPALCGQHVNPLSCLKTTTSPSTKTSSSNTHSSSSSSSYSPFNSLFMLLIIVPLIST